jgi:hypothetical protein
LAAKPARFDGESGAGMEMPSETVLYSRLQASAGLSSFVSKIMSSALPMTAHLDGAILDGRHHMQVRVFYEDTDFSDWTLS